MVAKVNAEVQENKQTIENFGITAYPTLLWLTEGDQDWERRAESTAEDLVGFIGERMEQEQIEPLKHEIS